MFKKVVISHLLEGTFWYQTQISMTLHRHFMGAFTNDLGEGDGCLEKVTQTIVNNVICKIGYIISDSMDVWT